MKTFKFNQNSLEFIEISKTERILKSILIISIIFILIGTNIIAKTKKIEENSFDYLTEQEILVIVDEYNKFSEEKLFNEIKKRNFKFPYIVYAQAILETGYFTSDLFKSNNNLFGMRKAVRRITTAIETQNNHAYYINWRESLEDYGYYTARYLNKLTTEEEYYRYLSQHYAEDIKYVEKLKQIIVNDNLKEKFN